jgi:hypothetical protein
MYGLFFFLKGRGMVGNKGRHQALLTLFLLPNLPIIVEVHFLGMDKKRPERENQ